MSLVDRINELERVMYGKGIEQFGAYKRKVTLKTGDNGFVKN